MRVNLRMERRLLQHGLRASLEKLDPELGARSTLLPRPNGKPPRQKRWVDRLTDLTLLYPLLVTEPLRMSLERRRAYLLPHALFVLYAHIDDRQRDGQNDGGAPADGRLAAALLTAACVSLERAGGPRWDSSTPNTLLAAYRAAQAVRADNATDLARNVLWRHLPGIVTSVCLLEAGRCRRSRIEQTFNGFRHLALSLQWMDDLRDIEEDLATGADNLLLARVPRTNLEATPIQLIACLHRSGIFVLALEESRRHLSAARSIAASTACRSLAELLDARIVSVTRLLRHANENLK